MDRRAQADRRPGDDLAPPPRSRAAPRTSLVVSTFDRPDALALALRSALGQARLPDEILVADDGSGEATRRVIEAAAAGSPVPLRHCRHERRGFRLAAIRNRALALAAGDYLILVDGDLLLDPAFVADHLAAARPGRWVQGSRALLSEASTRAALEGGRTRFGPLEPGLGNRKNALRLPWLSRLASWPGRDVYRVRGANLAFWREDALRVNGFDEAFEGWGREDSDFAARLGHAGVERLHLRFAAVAFHLWHPPAARVALAENQRRLEATLARRAVRCERGVDRHLAAT